jgi:serine/threonine protein phosphatase PrpC
MNFDSSAKKFSPVEKTQIMRVPALEAEEVELGEGDLEIIEDKTNAKKITRVPEGIRLEKKEAESRFQVSGSTEASPDHPDRNEDKHFYSAERGIIGLWDGMGGVPAGDYAASMAANQMTKEQINAHLERAKTPEDIRTAGLIKKVFDSPRDTKLRQEEVESAMKAMIHRMNSEVEKLGSYPAVRQKGIEYFNKNLAAQLGTYDERNPQHQQMLEITLGQIGCTASMMKMWRDKNGQDQVTVGQVGDSRIYRLRDGKMDQLTKDDSHVQVLIEEGLLKDDQDLEQTVNTQDILKLAETRKELGALAMKYKNKPPQQIKLKSFRNMILQGVGISKVMKDQLGLEFAPQAKTYDAKDGDIYIDVSDGVSDVLTDEEIHGIAERYKDQPSKIGEELQKTATLRSVRGDHPRSKKDDVTALVAKFSRS